MDDSLISNIAIFPAFEAAHRVYGKLQEQNPAVDIMMPKYDPEAERLELEVHIDSRPEPKTQGLDTGERPFSRFQNLPQQLKGRLHEVTTLLRAHIDKIQELPVTLYKQYADAIEKLFVCRPILKNMGLWFGRLLANGEQAPVNVTQEFEYRISLRHPAKLVIYQPEGERALKYNFYDKSLLLSGFGDKDLVTPLVKGMIRMLSLPVDNWDVSEPIITESMPSRIFLTPVIEDALCERTSIYQQTADDILDRVLQRLVVADLLDALQNVVIKEEGGLYLFFSPVLEMDEVETVVHLVKEVYPQAALVASPMEEEVDYWVVDISKMADTAVQVANMGIGYPRIEKKPGGTIAKKAQDTLTKIAQEVDVDQALSVAGEE